MYKYHCSYIYKILTIVLLFLGLHNEGHSQSTLGIELDYITGFQDKPLTIYNSTINYHMPNGFQLGVTFQQKLKASHWRINGAIGGKYIKSQGDIEEGSQYAASTFRLNAAIAPEFQFDHKWSSFLQFMIENNRDLQETTYLKTNLWRFYSGIGITYHLTNKTKLVATYLRSLNVNQDVYLLYIPANQIMLGLKFNFNEI